MASKFSINYLPEISSFFFSRKSPEWLQLILHEGAIGSASTAKLEALLLL